jgi:hypothetical protein
MSAESAIYTLLAAAAPVTALVGARIYPGMLPNGQPLPAIVIEQISAVRLGRLDAGAATHPTSSRMQVNLLAKDYPTLKALRTAVMTALQFKRGALGGSAVISVLPGFEGPDTFDSGMEVFHQPLDFMVTHEA